MAAADSDFKAVFFDFGGTLFSYRTIDAGNTDRPLFVEAAERLGVPVEDRKSIGRAYRKASAEAFQKYTVMRYYLHRDMFLDTFRGFAENLGGTPTPEFVEWLYACQRDMLVESFELRADCIDTLAKLRASGLYLSIVSNIDDDYLHPMVARAGLEDVLHHWTSSEEAQSCKPDEGFFRLALEKADCGVDDVLFVGDSPTHDVAGASALGMRTALILEEGVDPPGQVGDAPSADHEIRSLSELLEICAK
jgi:HAD superfamily hydrolase (TIGR01549 family)